MIKTTFLRLNRIELLERIQKEPKILSDLNKGLYTSTLTKALKEFKDAELITTVKHSTRKQVRLTEKGKEILQALKELKNQNNKLYK